MEELGNLISRYCIIKSEGMFSKYTCLLNIYENGIELKPVSCKKSSKTKDMLLYKDFNSAIPSNNNDKELALKLSKLSFNITCASRLHLLVELMLYKNLWDLKNNPSPGVKSFECYKEMVFNDRFSYIPIRVAILHSALLIESAKGEFKELEKYIIRYNDIQNIIMLSYAVAINTKVIVIKPLE